MNVVRPGKTTLSLTNIVKELFCYADIAFYQTTKTHFSVKFVCRIVASSAIISGEGLKDILFG